MNVFFVLIPVDRLFFCCKGPETTIVVDVRIGRIATPGMLPAVITV